MYYHFTIILLFWPVIECSITGTELLPQKVCSEAADAIGTLVTSYARLYTLQRTPSLVPYFVLTAAIVRLATITSYTHANSAASERGTSENTKRACFSALEALDKDISALAEMTQCHPLAEKALSIISFLVDEWNVGIEVDAGEISLQDCIEICRPYDRRLQYLPIPGFFGKGSIAEMRRSQPTSPMTEAPINSSQHPLFSPFVHLRQQTTVTDHALRQAGFTYLR